MSANNSAAIEVGAKVPKKWNGEVSNLSYRLQSEKAKKYETKLKLINDEIAKYINAKLIEFFNLIEKKKKLSDDSSSRLKSAFDLCKQYIKIKGEIADINEQLGAKSTKPKESADSTDEIAKEQLRGDRRTKELAQIGIKFQILSLLEQDSRYYYERKILTVLYTVLGYYRLWVANRVRESGAVQIERGLYMLLTADMDKLLKSLNQQYLLAYESVNMHIRMQTLFWIIDERCLEDAEIIKKTGITPSSPIVDEIKALKDEYDRRMKSPYSDPNFVGGSNVLGGIKNFRLTYNANVFKDQFDQIMELWLKLSDTNIQHVIDEMNAEHLTVKRRVKSTRNIEQGTSKEIDVHWDSRIPSIIGYEKSGNPIYSTQWQNRLDNWNNDPKKAYYAPYPYVARYEIINVASVRTKVYISKRDSLLCHSIRDDYNPAKGGWVDVNVADRNSKIAYINNSPLDCAFNYQIPDNSPNPQLYKAYGFNAYSWISFTRFDLKSQNNQTTFKFKQYFITDILNAYDLVINDIVNVKSTLTSTNRKANLEQAKTSLENIEDAFAQANDKADSFFSSGEDVKKDGEEAKVGDKVKWIKDSIALLKNYIEGTADTVGKTFVFKPDVSKATDSSKSDKLTVFNSMLMNLNPYSLAYYNIIPQTERNAVDGYMTSLLNMTKNLDNSKIESLMKESNINKGKEKVGKKEGWEYQFDNMEIIYKELKKEFEKIGAKVELTEKRWVSYRPLDLPERELTIYDVEPSEESEEIEEEPKKKTTKKKSSEKKSEEKPKKKTSEKKSEEKPKKKTSEAKNEEPKSLLGELGLEDIVPKEKKEEPKSLFEELGLDVGSEMKEEEPKKKTAKTKKKSEEIEGEKKEADKILEDLGLD